MNFSVWSGITGVEVAQFRDEGDAQAFVATIRASGRQLQISPMVTS